MSLFKRGEIVDISKTAEVQMELDKRVSRLEDEAYEAKVVADGGKRIGGALFRIGGGGDELYSNMMHSYLGFPKVGVRPNGISFGRVSDLRTFKALNLDDNKAMMLRDWLLELYPLPAPKKGAKK